jgi:hypothetical protein
MDFVEAFFALFVPTAVAVWLIRQDVNHVAAGFGWLIVSLLVLGWLGADQPTELSPTPEEGSVKLVYFYLDSGASALALALGMAAGVVAGLVVAESSGD